MDSNRTPTKLNLNSKKKEYYTFPSIFQRIKLKSLTKSQAQNSWLQRMEKYVSKRLNNLVVFVAQA